MKVRRVLRIVGLFVAAAMASGLGAQSSPTTVKAVQLTGLPGIKQNAKGKLSVENGNLHFASGRMTSDVSIGSIQDVIAGSDSQKAVGKTIGTISMAAPYGGGRVVSLFRRKIDTLTVEYRDADGGFHGVIFTMPPGDAGAIRKELAIQGAHTALAAEPARDTQTPSGTSPKEQRQ